MVSEGERKSTIEPPHRTTYEQIIETNLNVVGKAAVKINVSEISEKAGWLLTFSITKKKTFSLITHTHIQTCPLMINIENNEKKPGEVKVGGKERVDADTEDGRR